VRTAALFGVVNALVAGLGASLIAEAAPRRSRGVVAGLVTTALLVLFAYGDTVARATAD
jgi:MFS family permease